MNKSFLITGASGYIASRLIPALVKQGYNLTGLDRASHQPTGLRNFICGDLNDPEAVDKALEGIDGIFHLAAAKGDWGISDAEYIDDNVNGTKVLLDRATNAGIKNWIFYSTVAVLGSGDTPRNDSAPLAPENPYGRSKAACEELFEKACEQDRELKVIALRPSAVFGENHPDSTNVFRLIEGIRNKRFLMVGDGKVIKTTAYIENLIAAHLFLIDLPLDEGFHPFLYVDSPNWSTEKLSRTIADELGVRWIGPRVPLGVAATLGSLGDMAASISGIDLPVTSARIRKFCTPTAFDPAKLRQAGFEQPVPLEVAVSTTVRWHLGVDVRSR